MMKTAFAQLNCYKNIVVEQAFFRHNFLKFQHHLSLTFCSVIFLLLLGDYMELDDLEAFILLSEITDI